MWRGTGGIREGFLLGAGVGFLTADNFISPSCSRFLRISWLNENSNGNVTSSFFNLSISLVSPFSIPFCTNCSSFDLKLRSFIS